MSVRSPHEELDVDNNRLIGAKDRNAVYSTFDLSLERSHVLLPWGVEKSIPPKPWTILHEETEHSFQRQE